MKIVGFDIANFKGVQEAKIRFAENDTARVHTLVGLNESGKTTLLEALHSFSPDAETERVVRNARSAQEQREQWVPRDKISTFTGDVTITAHVVATEDDWQPILEAYVDATDLMCDPDSLPLTFTVRLAHSYQNGDFQETTRTIDLPELEVKTQRAKIYRDPTVEQLEPLENLVESQLPTIAYYPTFVFDFPERIYLTERDESARNQFYRQLFQDILDYDGSGYTIEKSVLARLHKEESRGLFDQWFPAFVGTSEEDKVKQVMARAEQAVTDLVFSRWYEVFGEEVGGKEIAIEIHYEPGEPVKTPDGRQREATEHDAYIRFRVKDGSSLYSVDDRSLGFRWFFSFLLFTQFRIHRSEQRPTIFLFDEPASNLHAAAQQKLLESFPAIAEEPHRLIYSTHSHYMVDPRWLEQAYIVFDEAAEPGAIIDQSVRADSHVNIKAIPYRQFVAERPTQTSYFQPILDTLEVRPSQFDYSVGGLIVEGKGDFYLLRAAAKITGTDLGPIFPATGSGTMRALVALHRGWGLPVRVLFDSDQGGRDGKRNLRSEFGLSDYEYSDLKSLNPKLTTIEDVFSVSDRKTLTGGAGGEEKTLLMRALQECLAADQFPQLTAKTRNLMDRVVRGVQLFAAGENSHQSIKFHE